MPNSLSNTYFQNVILIYWDANSLKHSRQKKKNTYFTSRDLSINSIIALHVSIKGFRNHIIRLSCLSSNVCIVFAVSTLPTTATFYFLFFAERRPTERDGLWAGALGVPRVRSPVIHFIFSPSLRPCPPLSFFPFIHLKRGTSCDGWNHWNIHCKGGGGWCGL